MNDTDDEMDTAVIEEEDWIECMKRSTDEAIEQMKPFPWRPNSDEFASGMACAFFVLFFPIHVIAHCRQQCPSRSFCQECKA